ncbi:unnamed protein product [Adineta steineri]|uniref:Uncharacterized protein n=2 Tax=Adineta steineri TaxID=433720 RepID=A0A813Y4C1_9BILA|nr:unnamed protein product [Adineta steineri]
MSPVFDSSNDCRKSIINLNTSYPILHLDRMKTKKHYDCFPEYIYNTAFGSLLTNLNCNNQPIDIDDNNNKLKINNIDNHCTSSIQLYNNEQDIIKLLVDFLDEFLLYLSSIISYEKFQSQFQLQKIKDVFERVYQLRSTLLIHINNNYEYRINSTILDITSISSILHELATLIHSLDNEQQLQIGTNTQYSQLSYNLEKIMKSCMDSINKCNHQQNVQSSIPSITPCINSTLPNTCLSSCNGCNMCEQWSILEQIKNSNEKDHIFGLVYGIKDENIRRKLGYRTGDHKSSSKIKQKFRKISKQKYGSNMLLNKEAKFDSNREWTTGSPSNQASIQRQQSFLKSKQFSPLSNTNSDTDKSIKLHSIQDRLIISNSNGRITPHGTSSYTEQLPITSITDPDKLHRTSSRLVQKLQSNIYKENDSKSNLSSPLSFQTSEYRTPSKTTYKIVRESNHSLSPISNKSINTHESYENSSINSIDKANNVLSITQNNDKQSLNQNLISYETHPDNIDSSMMFTFNDKIPSSENMLNTNWKKRLTSTEHIEITPLEKNISNSMSNKQYSTDDFNFDNYSEHQLSSSLNNPMEENSKPIKLYYLLKILEYY